MKQQIITYNQNTQSFQIDHSIVNIDSEDCKNNFKYFFEQYQKFQDQIHNKFPFSNYITVAKIQKVKPNKQFLDIQYYYEGLDGEQLDIPYIDQKSRIDEGFRWAFPLALSEKEMNNLDIPILKSVLFNLIEIFYWSANFGFFIDPIEDCLYYYKEQEQFLLLPTFTLITKYLSQFKENNLHEKFLEFRRQHYQNATYYFLQQFYLQFSTQLKETDEDLYFFKRYFIKQLSIDNWNSLFKFEEYYKGADYLYKDEIFKNKIPRTRFKQTMLLYQLENNQELQNLFEECCQNDAKLITQNVSNNTILNEQFTNFIKFFQGLPKEFKSQSYEIYGQFMSIMNQYIKSKNLDENKIDMAPYSKVTLNQHKIDIHTSQVEQTQTTSIAWSSLINKTNKIIGDVQNQFMPSENLIINYVIIKNPSNIIIKTQISEVQFSIDTADDIIYLANMLIKEPTAINIHVDEARKLTLSTSIQTASPMQIFRIFIKIFDILQIYYHMILEFYRQNIQLGRSIKDKKYQLFVSEIQHYVLDYEIDFDEQMKKFDQNNQDQIKIQ
ncbi:unnamed protein product [Paramecium pentaurelia]|uniref:Uncharacterized protein n=1 Tax=Paramecium pentaurelia TaxID=43138 RepID=A0A8S1XVT5_9CILI|nr:unnamed protein product [Paramecium pentaurelia]